MILRWLTPLGLIALVAIAALAIVYLFRPQYRKKTISGTVVWKRVLLREKKHHPAFDHVLLFILQSLVLAIFAVGIAQPRLYTRRAILEDAEYIMIVDASASMRASLAGEDGNTRFGRAVAAAKEEINALFDAAEEGTVSLIVADSEPAYLFSDLKKSDSEQVFGMLDALTCTLEEGDLEGAVKLAGSRLEDNPYAKIFLYTDTSFGNLGTAVDIVDVSDETKEQNVGVLGCTVGRRDNRYFFEIVLGAYGNVTLRRNVSVDIKGADNGRGPRNFHLEVPVSFAVGEDGSSREQTVRVSVSATDPAFGGHEDWFFETYDEVEIYIPDLNDSIPDDDRYFVYGGIRDTIDIEYWSADSNTFWQYGFNNLANNMSGRRAISFKEIYSAQDMRAENSGYDFYIFEHSIPSEIMMTGLPRDGVIVIVDPDDSLGLTPLGLSVGETVSLGALTSCTGVEHPLLRYMDPSRISLTQYKKLTVADGSMFEPILFSGDDPVMLVKNTPSSKVVVMPFSINMSDFFGEQFQIFLYDLLEHFMPYTIPGNDFSFGETIRLDCKGTTLEVAHDSRAQIFTSFPAEFTFTDVGTYVFTTRFAMEKASEVRRAYVHAPASESDLFAEPGFRMTLDNRELTTLDGTDFFMWMAVAALALMVTEWCIHYRYII